MTTPHGLRLIFAGTPEFAAVPLRQLLARNFRPDCVLTQPDRPAGRGRKLQASPVKQVALGAEIEVYQPESLRREEHQQLLRELKPDLMIVVAYGLILPRAVLDIPRLGCWNIHASLLPRWRGAAPIHRAIEAGDTETGVCIMQMDEGLDTGPVLHRKTLALNGSESSGLVHDKLAALGAKALMECLRLLQAGNLPPAVPQQDEGITYATKLHKSEAELDWTLPAELLERRVRAFDPWPAAWCVMADERTRIWKSSVIKGATGARPGEIIAASPAGIDIATGQQALRLLELQPAGKRRMSAADYLNSRKLPKSLAVGT